MKETKINRSPVAQWQSTLGRGGSGSLPESETGVMERFHVQVVAGLPTFTNTDSYLESELKEP